MNLTNTRLTLLLVTALIIVYMGFIYFIQMETISAIIVGFIYFGIVIAHFLYDYVRHRNNLDRH